MGSSITPPPRPPAPLKATSSGGCFPSFFLTSKAVFHRKPKVLTNMTKVVKREHEVKVTANSHPQEVLGEVPKTTAQLCSC